MQSRNIEPVAQPVKTTITDDNYPLVASCPTTIIITTLLTRNNESTHVPPITLEELVELATTTTPVMTDSSNQDDNKTSFDDKHERYQAELLRIIGIIDSQVAA
jgi:hypothetical protein